LTRPSVTNLAVRSFGIFGPYSGLLDRWPKPSPQGGWPSTQRTLHPRGARVQFIATPHRIADMGSYELWMTFFRDPDRNPLTLRS